MIARELGGYVLAGGLSSRMGTDKAFLEWRGEPLGSRVAGAVKHAVGSAVIVGDPVRYRPFGYPVIPDRFPRCGPLGGIHAALAHTAFEWNLILACDLPGMNGAGLQNLLNEAKQVASANEPSPDALLPLLDGQPQPLCALYNRRILSTIEQALTAGRLKITAALRSVSVVAFPWENERLFANANTPEEWESLLHT